MNAFANLPNRHSGAMRIQVGCCRLGQTYLPNSGKPEFVYRTRNLEIPGLVLAHHPGMTAKVLPALLFRSAAATASLLHQRTFACLERLGGVLRRDCCDQLVIVP